MQKPTRQQIETASDEQLAEWSAIYLKEWRFNILKAQIREAWKKDLWYLDKNDNPIIRYLDWNPAQNIAQAFELLIDFTLWAINRLSDKRIKCLISIGRWKVVSSVDWEISRAITKAALLAVIGG